MPTDRTVDVPSLWTVKEIDHDDGEELVRKKRSSGTIPLSTEITFQLGVWLRRRGGLSAWLGNFILVPAVLQIFEIGGWWRSEGTPVCTSWQGSQPRLPRMSP